MELLGRLAMEMMLGKLSTRRYPLGLEPVGEAVAAGASATSKSSVSRRFVTATEKALTDLMAADLSTVNLVALMIDGVRFAEHTCIVALGITADGTKVPLGVVEHRPHPSGEGLGAVDHNKHRPSDIQAPVPQADQQVSDGGGVLR